MAKKKKMTKKQQQQIKNVTSSKWFIWLIIVVLFIVVAAGGYFGYSYYDATKKINDIEYEVVFDETDTKRINVSVKVNDEKKVLDYYDVCVLDVNNDVVSSIDDNTIVNEFVQYEFTKLKANRTYKIGLIYYRGVVSKNLFVATKNYLNETYVTQTLSINDEELHVYVLEMHDKYGDSLYIKKGDFDMLIDSGDAGDGEYVRDFIEENISEDKKLEVLVVTHAHSDHMGGLVKMSNSDSKPKSLDAVDSIDYIIDYGHSRNSNTMHSSWVTKRQEYIDKGAVHYPAYDAVNGLNGLTNIIEIEENFTIEIVDTNNYVENNQLPSSTNYNEYSVATLITYYETKLFAAGDLEDAGENKLVSNASNTGINDITEEDEVIYKACHHGTDVGTNRNADGGNKMSLLKLIKPDYFIISSTIGESDHPYVKTIANFLWFSDEIYFNGTNGTLDILLDGSDVNITGFGATVKYSVPGYSNMDYDSQKNLKYTDTLHYMYSLYGTTGVTRKAAVESAYQALLTNYPK